LLKCNALILYTKSTKYWRYEHDSHIPEFYKEAHKECDHYKKHSYHLLYFQAPYLPWVLLGFSVLLGNAIWVDLMGMAVGHTYYFVEDVFPNQRGGFRLLTTPQIL
jgi:hypothetical protein